MLQRNFTPFLVIIVLAFAGSGMWGCSSAAKLRAQQRHLASQAEYIHDPAYVCMPKALALAESHLQLADWEIEQGDYNRAKEHQDYVIDYINKADLGSQDPVCYGDRDEDGLADALDDCPDDPETYNGFDDEDGCPEADSDGDGILDELDACPDQPEDMDGDADEDGCPDIIGDKDGDGILDSADRCPDDPEDKDQYQDEDGCPEPDNDGDGICDPFVAQRGELDKYRQICKGSDQCPMEKEDMDFQLYPISQEKMLDIETSVLERANDEDGCPDPDNDMDKIPDSKDKCPWEAEQYNGRSDEDGCPEVGRDLNITEEVYFAVNKAEVLEKSYPLLDDIAKVLNERPEILKVRIEGHTDDQGRADYNFDLSDRRAKEVRNQLIKRGVDPNRLVAYGFGEDRPKVDITGLKRKSPELKEARAQNRRVEFKIIERAETTTPTSDQNNAQ